MASATIGRVTGPVTGDDGIARIPVEVFDSLGGAAGILRLFFEEFLEGLALPEQLETLELLEPLITPSGTRNIVERSQLVVESFRNERERMNLLYWQLTCESFHDVENWEWIFRQCGYSGDWGFIFFE